MKTQTADTGTGVVKAAPVFRRKLKKSRKVVYTIKYLKR
jgi:hypothetical protein